MKLLILLQKVYSANSDISKWSTVHAEKHHQLYYWWLCKTDLDKKIEQESYCKINSTV